MAKISIKISLEINHHTRDLELEKKIMGLKPAIRLFCKIKFPEIENSRDAIIDTGAHISLVPLQIWNISRRTFVISMSLKEKVYEITKIEKEKIPASPQIIGSVLLAKFPAATKNEKIKTAKAWVRLLPKIKTVGEIKGIRGELRQPEVVKLLGNGFATVHKEHGILYGLDASKIMFSKGNHFERRRLMGIIKPDEIIVDMFAGIGYFSLGMAKHARHVIAIEKNPLSFKYLVGNVRLNKIKNITLVKNDCRNVELEGTADRVLLGYFPHTEQFLPFAKKFAKKGAIIHYHNIYKKGELRKKAKSELGRLKILNIVIIKSYAPGIVHACVDAKIG